MNEKRDAYLQEKMLITGGQLLAFKRVRDDALGLITSALQGYRDAISPIAVEDAAKNLWEALPITIQHGPQAEWALNQIQGKAELAADILREKPGEVSWRSIAILCLLGMHDV